MANLPISGLTASASNLASTDLAPVVQTVGVGPVKMTGLQLAGGLLGSTTFNGSTVTTSSPVLNLTQTWNAGAVTFTGLKFNATDTASASGSLLLDLQVGGTGKVQATKAGTINAVGGVNVGSLNDNATFANIGGYATITNLNGGNGVGFTTYGGNAGSAYMLLTGSTVALRSTSILSWSATGDPSAGKDFFLSRGGTATLQLGAADAAAPVAQTFKVQGVVAGTSNTAGANFTIQGSQGTGTGAGGSIIFQVAPAGSTGTAQNAYSTALTIDSTRTATFAAGATFAAAVQGATNIGATNNLFAGAAFNNAAVLIGSSYGGIASVSTGFVSWTSSTTDPSGTRDLILARDAANTLALRNGTNAQLFRVYNTYTSSTNYETFKVDWITTANTCLIGTEKGSGGGTARSLALQTDGATRLEITGTGGALFNYAYWHFRSTGSSSASASVISPANGVMTLGNYNADNFDRLQFGGTSSSFPALKRSSARLQVTDATGAFGQNTGVDTANVAYQGVTFANLPTAAAGIVAYVTDASNAGAAWGDSVTAGGSTNKYLVWYNGTNWTVIGK